MFKILDTPGFSLYQVTDHIRIKNDILKVIKNAGKFSVEDSTQRIFNTNYYLKSELQDRFKEIPIILKNELQICINLFNKEFNYSYFNINDLWFQQYLNGDFHGIHSHPGCNFSSVYYLELDSLSAKTSFWYLNKEFEYSIKEGDILTFPSFYKHRSFPNKGSRKTVIAFNSNAY
jgi:hypothetical protein